MFHHAIPDRSLPQRGMSFVRIAAFACALALVLAVSVLLPTRMVQVAAASLALDNGDFEMGNLAGWTNVTTCGGQNARWYTYSGRRTPLTGHTILPPPQGQYAAVTDETGPSTMILYRDFVVPSGTALSFIIYYQNQAGVFYSPQTLDCSFHQRNQQYRVDLIKPHAPIDSVASGDVLLNLFRTPPGSPPNLYYTRITKDLSAFSGQAVRLRFAVAVNAFFFHGSVDDVDLHLANP